MIQQAAEDNREGQLKTVFDALTAQEKYRSANVEGLLNSLGYTFSYVGEMDRALKVFYLNAEKFPSSWNAFDSLGEAYEQTQNREQALWNYEKAIQLNTENENDNNTRLKDRIEELENKK